MPAPFLLLSGLCLSQRWGGHPFLLLLLQAAQRVGVALFPLPLLTPSLSVLRLDALLHFQAVEALLLCWGDKLSQLDSLDVVQGRLTGFVQYDGVENDVK